MAGAERESWDSSVESSMQGRHDRVHIVPLPSRRITALKSTVTRDASLEYDALATTSDYWRLGARGGKRALQPCRLIRTAE